MQNLCRRLQILTSSVNKLTKFSAQKTFLEVHLRRYATTDIKKPQEFSKCEPKPDQSWKNDPNCGKDGCADAKQLDSVCPDDDFCDRGPFNQTWADCPPRIVEELPICLGGKMQIPTPRKGKPRQIAKQQGLKDRNESCSKIQFANCKEVSQVVKCKRTRMPSDCVPIPAPCLSFSECEKDLPPWKTPTECNCFEKQCQVTDV